MPQVITYTEVGEAAERIAGRVRRATVCELEIELSGQLVTVVVVHEYLQHTGSFKARGAVNLLEAHRRAGTLPEAGLCIASGGNAGLACAWAAQAAGQRATVFVPVTVPAVKLQQLRGYGAEVRLAGTEYADALAACLEFAERSGALLSHAYDNPLIAAGAGTCAAEVLAQLPAGLDSLLVAVGGGGLLAGTIAATAGSGCRVVAVEPEGSRALAAALAAGAPVDVPVDSIAADSLGARRVSGTAYQLSVSAQVESVLVTDAAIRTAREYLWWHSRIVVEPGGATALAALLSGRYRPVAGERVAVILCGANTDPSDLVAVPT